MSLIIDFNLNSKINLFLNSSDKLTLSTLRTKYHNYKISLFSVIFFNMLLYFNNRSIMASRKYNLISVESSLCQR